MRRLYLFNPPRSQSFEINHFWSRWFNTLRLRSGTVQASVKLDHHWYSANLLIEKHRGKYWGKLGECEIIRPEPGLTVLLAVLKDFYMDLAVRSMSELEVTTLYLFKSEHSVGFVNQGTLSKLERISLEHASLIGREIPLELKFFASLKSLLVWLEKKDSCDELIAIHRHETLKYYFWPLAEKKLSENDLKFPCIGCIGPEGDFTAKETDLLKSHGFEPKNLGDRVLTSWSTACLISSLCYARKRFFAPELNLHSF
ncbi:MAG: RsmE family RNA methyltransferase [Deltaproteobacteria bacterium]|nr:RsmE family RNA methyltransferase [Deltaproteobacteria bacterium]